MSAWQMASVELPRDASGFVRRQCPSCQRVFKTRPSSDDARILLRRLVSHFPFENAHEVFEAVPTWSCLYCGYRAAADEWLTREQGEHLEALARAWASHVRYEQLAHVSRTLSQNPRPTFIAVPPGALPGALPPEPDDLRPIPLVCCGEEVKALWDWDAPLFCPRCGTHHGGLSGRQQIHLQFIEE